MNEEMDVKQLIEQIQSLFREFKEKIAVSKQIKGRKRLDYIEKVKDSDFKRIRNYINNLQSSIYYNQQGGSSKKIKEQKSLVQNYKTKLDKLLKKLESSKNQELNEKTLFQNRNEKEVNESQRHVMIQDIDKAQADSQNAVRNALRNMYQMQGIGRNVNIELQRQINQLDSIYQNLNDTESTMNRALQHIKYFARSVYTDKLLMGLIALIFLSIIAIIVLMLLGKIPSAKSDSII